MQTKPYTAKAKPYIQPVVPYIEKAKPYAPPFAAAVVVLASIPVFFTLFLLAAVTSPVSSRPVVQLALDVEAKFWRLAACVFCTISDC